MRDIMRLNFKRSSVAEWLVVAAVLLIKTVLAQPLYEQIFWLTGSYYISQAVVLSAGAAIVLAVMLSLTVKAASNLSDEAKVIAVLLVAEPMLISTSVSLFHVISVLITVIWVMVCIKIQNRIVAAAVSVASAAAISFIMPCSVFSLVALGIIVLLITTKGDTLSVTATLIGAVVSVIATVINVQLSDIEIRIHFGLYQTFNKFGENECHPLIFDRWEAKFELSTLLEQFGKVAFASLPVIVFAACIVYGVIRYSGEKKADKAENFKKGITAALIIAPYVLSAIGATLCTGVGALTAFNFAPLAVILAFASTGNKYVIDALKKVSGFAKAHPVVSVIAIVWIASYTMAFTSGRHIFSYATQFFI